MRRAVWFILLTFCALAIHTSVLYLVFLDDGHLCAARLNVSITRCRLQLELSAAVLVRSVPPVWPLRRRLLHARRAPVELPLPLPSRPPPPPPPPPPPQRPTLTPTLTPFLNCPKVLVLASTASQHGTAGERSFDRGPQGRGCPMRALWVGVALHVVGLGAML
jgi:hypothetical protein